MSESDNQPTPPPPSTPKTSAVPLKKETVRITLRSRPGEGSTQPREATAPVSPITSSVPIAAPRKATAPVQLPSAPLPPPAPKSATSPVKLPPAPVPVAAPAPSLPVPPPAVRPAVPAPPAPPAATVPMAPPTAPMGGAPRPPMPPAAPRPAAPTAPAIPGAAPKMETGATTAPLAKTMPLKPAAPGPRPVGGTGTGPMVSAPGGAPTAGLPKATVKLQPTQPMSRPSISAPPSAPVKRTANTDAEQFYNEEGDPEGGLVPLSVVCLLLSAVLLVVQMFGSDMVSSSDSSPIMVPAPVPVKWEVRNEDRSWTNNFTRALPTIPE